MSFLNRIKFYRTSDEFGAFSNFAKYPVKWFGHTFPTSEHLYQAMKFFDNEMAMDAIRDAKTAKEAANLGRSLPGIREDWEEVKLEVMYYVLTQKFTQHKELKELLLSTGDAEIVEHTHNDSFWGDGGDGKGQNHLGKLLMRLRDDFNAQKEVPVAQADRAPAS
jgi:ribA/ribD-fused uncharacterized protein